MNRGPLVPQTSALTRLRHTPWFRRMVPLNDAQVGRGQRRRFGRLRGWASRYKFRSQPHPNDFGVTSRRSYGFHQRDLTRRLVGRRQS